MATKTILYDDFRKGRNDTVAPNQLEDDEMFEAINLDLSERGGFSRRKGVVPTNSVKIGTQLMSPYEWICGNLRIILNVKYDGTTYSFGKIEGDVFTPRQTVLSGELAIIVIRNVLYFGDGTNIYEWGAYDYTPASGTVNLVTNDVVMNTDGEFYRSKLTRSSVNLSTETYTNTTNWELVTLAKNVVCDYIRPIKANPDVTNNIAPIKKCTYFLHHPASFRIFAYGNPDEPTALYFSEANEMGYWKGTNKLYPSKNDGGITAICNLTDCLMVSYNTMWYYWRGVSTADMTWKPLPLPYGCKSQGSLALTPFSITYLGDDNIYNVTASILSSEVVMLQPEQIIKSLTEGTQEIILNSIKVPKNAKAIFHKEKYMLAFNDDESLNYNNKVLVYYWNTKGVVINEGLEIYGWIEKNDGELLIASRGWMLIADTGYSDWDTQLGQKKPIRIFAETKFYNLKALLNPKYLSRMFFVFRQTLEEDPKVDIRIFSDYRMTGFYDVNLAESLVWGREWGNTWGWNDMIIKGAFLSAVANTFKIQFENDDLDSQITVYAIGFEYELLEPNPAMINYREEELLI